MNNFREHDRAVEASPERKNLSAALSRLTQVNSELQLVRVQLQEERASASAYRAGVASNYARQQHLDRLAELQKTFDQLRHEQEGAKAEVAHLKAIIQTRRLEGRVEAHRQITGKIVGAMRTLRDEITADQQLRAQLAEAQLRFGGPLQSLCAFERGGEHWLDTLLPVVEEWLKEAERTDAYHLSKPRLQIA